MAMTLYSKSGVHNGRPTFTSANGKVLFYDGARWRVADNSFPTSGGDVQSAAGNTACPNEAYGWEASEARGSDVSWVPDVAVSVTCDCACSQLKVEAAGYHKLGVHEGSVMWELSGTGDMGRPVYKDYVGQSIMYSEELSAWFTSAEADSDGNQINRWFGLSTHTSGSMAFCPADIDPSWWVYDKPVSIQCTCTCNQVQLAVSLADAVSSAGIFTMGTKTAYGRPVFETPKGMYLYYYGPELRWLVGSSYTSAAGVVVRSAITSGYCPITETTAWFAMQADGTWRGDDVVEATCVPYSYTPPAPPPPMPPFGELCDCPMYEVSSAYSGPWQAKLFNDIGYQVMGRDDVTELNGARPVMKATKRTWSNVPPYIMYYYEGDGRWHIASHNQPNMLYTTARSAPSTATCADQSTGWEVRGGGNIFSPIGVTVQFTCMQHSPPAPPPTLVPSSMITCLPQMTQDACGFFAKQQGRTYNKDLKVCFGLKDGGFDACDKDEGSPLVVHGAGGKMVQVGITAKVGCGAANTPTEYTKVAKFKDWIIARIGDAKQKCMHSCPVEGCTNVAFPGARTCRGPCQICNSFGWG